MIAIARWLIVAVTICSWIAISNHCALRAYAAKTKTDAGSCPFHSKPSKPVPKSTGSECCKILRAIPTTPQTDLSPAITGLFPADKPFHQIATIDPLHVSFAPAAFATGPPGKTSFVELTASLRAHAPPFGA